MMSVGLVDEDTVNNEFVSLNIFFFTVFLIEMIIKITGLGPKGYIRDRMNIFDGTIVIVSAIEIIF